MKFSAFLPVAVGLLLLAGCGSGEYPEKDVTIICPWAAGGGTDRVARFWSDSLNKHFGKPFVVVNQTGGSGVIGHAAGAESKTGWLHVNDRHIRIGDDAPIRNHGPDLSGL